MERVVWATRILLLALSCYGYLRYISKNVRIELSIGLLFTGIGSVMFVAGLLDILRETAWMVFACGLSLTILSLWNKDNIKVLLCPGVIFFVVVTVYFFFLLCGSKFVFYDNFTHWGIVTRALANTDHFPDSTTVNLGHTSYPLGSACFIYYFTEIIGIAPEWLQMWAQAVLMTGVVTGVFVLGKQTEQILISVVSSLAILCCNINFVDLPVDTLLPVVAVSAIVFCIYYRENLSTRILLLLPYTVFLISIKNSGILFVVVVLLYSYISLKKDHQNLMKWSVIAITPFVVLLFWKRHVEQTFGSNVSRHSMSIANYHSVFAEKTAEENIATIIAFLEKVVSNADGAILLTVIALGIWLLQKSSMQKNKKEIKRLLLTSGMSYAVYQIGLLAMYLVSMPASEAIVAAQYYRYHQTIVIFCGGLLMISILLAIESIFYFVQQRKNRLVISIMILGIFCVALQPDFDFYRKQDLENTDRLRFDTLIEQYGITSQERYLLIITEDRYGNFYLTHMARYLLEPEFVLAKPVDYLDEEPIEDYDYIILFDETEEGRAFFVEYFGEQEADVIRNLQHS